MSRKGLLISFEGIDGAGKSTLATSVAHYLRSRGRIPILTQEPTTGIYGKRIRSLAAIKRPDPGQEYALFLKDREQHVSELILPELRLGHDVLCDRYFLSSVAYQGARGLDYRVLLHENLTRFPTPDLSLYIDITPAVSLCRTKQRGPTDRFDDSTDFEAVTRIYRSIHFDWYHTISGVEAPEIVLAACIKLLDPLVS